ncbi:MAG TPA: tRNA-specific 2-thiouridylase MnmA [Hyphomicrobiaceae bacterium MAG_BT-2024]
MHCINKTRIVVAMSGGVDSSVAAGLLKQQGYDVIGVTLQLYDNATALAKPGSCCAGQDIYDARRVAELLDIPHYVLNYEQRFRSVVMEAFADSYAKGETPIPCVFCNQTVKFLDLLETAREFGAVALATGHYVQRRNGPNGPSLYRGRDKDRDQSYFLFGTTREQLVSLRFPLGHMRKQQVRQLALEMKLPVAQKNDSQDICFVPTGRYSDVVAKLRPNAVKPGEIVDLDGNILGTHQGIINFTVGQRRGLGIASGEPLYVVRIDSAFQRIVVGPRAALLTTRLYLRNINWLGENYFGSWAPESLRATVKVRSTQALQPALLNYDKKDDIATVDLISGDYGVATGQACVFYDSNDMESRLLGGGWITKTGVDPYL